KEENTYNDPVAYYTFRFCKTFYKMTGITNLEWVKKEMSVIKETIYEYYGVSPEEHKEDEPGLKEEYDILTKALPELNILHRKILIKNEYEATEE
ncbi:MAG: hypothetical protein J5597_00380, partial [Spirochaetaceae bacterium]|nr:hypothetical protein [Spirochaetaceae bacterium]